MMKKQFLNVLVLGLVAMSNGQVARADEPISSYKENRQQRKQALVSAGKIDSEVTSLEKEHKQLEKELAIEKEKYDQLAAAEKQHKETADNLAGVVGKQKEIYKTNNPLIGIIYTPADAGDQRSLDLARAALETTQAEIKAAEKKRAELEAQVNKTKDQAAQKTKEAEALLESVGGGDDMQAYKAAQEALNKMKSTYYDSRFLLSDLTHLKDANQLDDNDIQGLKDAMDNRLDNTLMGEYVNRQISKLGNNFCTLQDTCAAGKTAELEKELKAILGEDSKTSKARVSARVQKPVEATKGADTIVKSRKADAKSAGSAH